MSEPQKRGRLSDMAVEALLKRIHSGELPVGTRLPSEPELAEEMGISRGILREALTSLQAKGYISRTPKGGSYIERSTDKYIGDSITAKVRTADLQELMEFREAIETRTVQYAIERATDEELDSLEELLTGRKDKPGEIDYYFHYRLAELSRNQLFVVLLDLYYDTICRFAQRSYHNKERAKHMANEHKRILTALKKRDKRAAVTAVKSHLWKVMARYSEDYDVDE